MSANAAAIDVSAAVPVGVIGDGRVARHFLHYFRLLGVPVCSWSRRAAAAAPDSALCRCRTVLLLIRDDAIVPFVEGWPGLRHKQLVHFSGSLTTPLAEAAHPLTTFGPDLYNLDTYRSIPFVLDAGGTPLTRLLPSLPNPSFTIDRGERPYYHALCVLAGNFSTLLWLKLFHEFSERLHLPASAAHAYLKQTMTNLLDDPGRALTGPLARGDQKTIDRNLRALDGDPFQLVYLAFRRTYEHRP